MTERNSQRLHRGFIYLGIANKHPLHVACVDLRDPCLHKSLPEFSSFRCSPMLRCILQTCIAFPRPRISFITAGNSKTDGARSQKLSQIKRLTVFPRFLYNTQ